MDELMLGDLVQMRKTHPCGSDKWTVIRVGADISYECGVFSLSAKVAGVMLQLLPKQDKGEEKPKKEKLTTVMDKELLQEVKVISAKTGLKLCDIIDECVRNALGERLFEDRY